MKEEGRDRIYYSWQKRYPQEIGLVKSIEVVLPDCAWLFPRTGEVLEGWRNEQTSITVNGVIVSPNEGELPLRAMSYLLGAIQTVVFLRGKGLKVGALRIINPCYLNVFCDGGDLNYQLSYGKDLITNFQRWLKKYFSGLHDLQLMLDQGSPIEDGAMNYAKSYAAKIDLTTLGEIQGRIKNHNAQEDRVALYLLAHPLAWQYETALNMFIPRGEGTATVNYMPQSEMLYLTTMKQAGIELAPQESGVVTSISRRVIHAPYYSLRENEPTLNWSVSAQNIQNTMGRLRSSAGHTHYAEILNCLGHIRFFLQNSKKKERGD